MSQTDVPFRIEKAKDGHPVPILMTGTGDVHLGSMYDGRNMAETWCEVQLHDGIVNLVLVGAGDIQIVLEAVDRISGIVVVYEPNRSLYEEMRTSPLFKKAQKSPRIIITSDLQIISNQITGFVNEDIFDETAFLVHPGYRQAAWKDDLEVLGGILDQAVEYRIRMKKAVFVISEDMIMNQLRNVFLLKNGILLSRLRRRWDPTVPMIIVGAGPSLKKNIDALRRVGDRACILCMDSAYPFLEANGIVPHMFVSMDVAKKMDMIGNIDEIHFPILVNSNTRPELIQRVKGDVIWGYDSHPVVQAVRSEIEDEPPVYQPDYGVMSLAVSSARELGTNKIIFVGMDMAYSDAGESHATMKQADMASGDEIIAEGYYGKSVKSREDWKLMKDWLEKIIAEDGQTEYINSTEGGVRIHGTVQSPLSQVVDNLRIDTPNWKGILPEKDVHVSDEEYNKMMHRFRVELDKLDRLCQASHEEVFFGEEWKGKGALDVLMTLIYGRREDTRKERFLQAQIVLKRCIVQIKSEMEAAKTHV